MMSDLDYWQLRLNEFIDTNEIDNVGATDKFNSLAGIGKVRFTTVLNELIQTFLDKYAIDPQ